MIAYLKLKLVKDELWTLFCQQNIQVYIHVLAVMVFTIYKDEEIEKKNIKEMCE